MLVCSMIYASVCIQCQKTSVNTKHSIDKGKAENNAILISVTALQVVSVPMRDSSFLCHLFLLSPLFMVLSVSR